MPKQHVLFGRPVPRLGARQLSLLLVGMSIFAVFSLVFTLPSAIPAGPRLSSPQFAMPKSLKTPPAWMTHLNPFKAPVHAPPRQTNDTDGESAWYSHYRWLTTPFSSSVTLDETRSVLPFLAKRPPIYCYYDSTVDKTTSVKDAESALLLAWRKAWWAAGFEPIILSPAEGEINPLYDELQRLTDIDADLRADIMRFMAWENMGGGLLAHRFLFPMGAYDDALLRSLRRGEFPALTRWKDLEDGLFAGPREDVASAIKLALASPHLKVVKTLVAAVNNDKVKPDKPPFAVDDAPQSLAFYSTTTLKAKYADVADEISTPATRHTGLRNLLKLINGHLQLTWQNLFAGGIAVVKPLPHHTTHMIAPAWNLASRLARCHDSPLPKSCPPNKPDCAPCDPSRLMPITTPAHLSNTTSTEKPIYTIGTVPHPYTLSSLHAMREDIDVSYIRRESDRDAWITALTQKICPNGIAAGARLLRFKEAVASLSSSSSPDDNNKTPKSGSTATSSLWLLAERRELPEDIDWHFGFSLPDGSNSEIPPNHDPADGPVPMPEELRAEPDLLELAREVIYPRKSSAVSARKSDVVKRRTKEEEKRIREAVEAWNLADTEAWRFARAYLGRKIVERRKWEEKERRYSWPGLWASAIVSSDEEGQLVDLAKSKLGDHWSP
ncbi:hypothetical protein QBC47DRAFT_456881 [Echria macrotheca]|uniref:Uncharacterized protein n=1 Tax=Echria macrotheca TaxID=438768 RepID=A0AAJ0FGN9_9PEZI|nr:hypothetical protein QBC47DRAFT_456881 [Echria macrotheca]